MPYEITPKKWNQTIHVQVERNGSPQHAAIRNKQTAYSDVVTPDMRTQAVMNYLTCKFVEKLPKVDKKEKAHVQEPEQDLPKFFTEEELKKMKKAALKALVEKHPETKVDASANKDELLAGLLKFNIPRE